MIYMKNTFKQAQEDVYYAINVGIGIHAGYIKVSAEELLEYYYIIKSWKDKLGNNAPIQLNEIIKKIEMIASDFIDALHDFYKKRKQLDLIKTNLNSMSSDLPDENKSDKTNELETFVFIFPPQNGVVC